MLDEKNQHPDGVRPARITEQSAAVDSFGGHEWNVRYAPGYPLANVPSGPRVDANVGQKETEMGSVYIRLDLSHANEQREDHLLATDIREHGEIPANRFWQIVYHDYYRNDIAETGNDLRFRSHHLWVDVEFRHYDRLHRYHDHRQLAESDQPPAPAPDIPLWSPTLPHNPLAITGGSVPAVRPEINGSVPEPSGLVLLGAGLAVAWVAWWRRRSGRTQGGRQRSPKDDLTRRKNPGIFVASARGSSYA
jgi:PEP-CTERM motif